MTGLHKSYTRSKILHPDSFAGVFLGQAWHTSLEKAVLHPALLLLTTCCMPWRLGCRAGFEPARLADSGLNRLLPVPSPSYGGSQSLGTSSIVTCIKDAQSTLGNRCQLCDGPQHKSSTRHRVGHSCICVQQVQQVQHWRQCHLSGAHLICLCLPAVVQVTLLQSYGHPSAIVHP